MMSKVDISRVKIKVRSNVVAITILDFNLHMLFIE